MGDHLVFRSLYLRQPPVPDAGVRLIDIEYPEETRQDQPTRFRQAVGSALTQLAALKVPPRVVLIDVWISSNPEGAEALIKGIAALRARGTKVYAAVDPKDRHGNYTADFMKTHHEAIYTSALDGYGHTQLDYGFGILKYDRELLLSRAPMEMRLPALPIRAAFEPDRADELPASLVIPLGADALFKPVTHRLARGSARIHPAIPADGSVTYAIIGSFKEDSDNLLERPGPLLVAWALSDLVAGKASVAREPLNHPLALFGMAALAALLAFAIFELSFRMARVKVPPPSWDTLTWVLPPTAFVLSALGVLGIGGIVLLSGRVIPVAFPLTCAALASAFAWFAAREWVADERLLLDLAAAREKRTVKYDVFISYCHEPPENKAWVKDSILAPLAALRRPDGKAYEIFFDERSIKVGRRWKREIELALLGTRCFVPVYSEAYFSRPYCEEELEIADQLRIEKRLQMFPVARTAAGISEIYLRKVQYIDAGANPEFISDLIARITDAVAPAGTPAVSNAHGK